MKLADVFNAELSKSELCSDAVAMTGVLVLHLLARAVTAY